MTFAGLRSGLVVVGAAVLLATAGIAEAGNRGCGRGGGGNWNRGCGSGGGSSFSIGFSSGGGCWSGSSFAFGYSSGSRCGPSYSWGYSSWNRPCRPVYVQPCPTYVPAYGYYPVAGTCAPRWVVAQPCAPVYVAPRPVCAAPVYGSPTYIVTDANQPTTYQNTQPAYQNTQPGYQSNAYAQASVPRVQTVRSESPSTRVTDYRAWQIETELAARAKAADQAATAIAARPAAQPTNITYVVETPQHERPVAGSIIGNGGRAPLPEPTAVATNTTTTTPTTTTTTVAAR